VKVGEGERGKPIWDYKGVAFQAFRHACGSLLLAHGKNLKQVQGWLRHSQLTTTMNVYIDQVDGGLGSADVWDEILEVPADQRSPRRARVLPSSRARIRARMVARAQLRRTQVARPA
jgi:hypothetical protein